MEYEDQIAIVTPEGVALTLTLAGLGSRAIALILDWLVRLPMLIVLAIIGAGSDVGLIIEIIGLFAVVYIYDVAFEVLAAGRTPGKRWTSLRVLRADGRPEGLGASAVRNVIRLVDFLPLVYVIGAASIITTTRNQRLGDLGADTIVVREPRGLKPPDPSLRAVMPPPPPQPTAGATWLPAWDVTAITQQDLAAVRTFLERRPLLADQARRELGQRLAAGMAAKIPGVGPQPDPERMLETLVAIKSARGR